MKIKKLGRLILCSLAIVLTIVYIIYRIFFTIPTTLGFVSIFFAILVLAVEIWESIDFFTYSINILSINKKSPQIPNMKVATEVPDVDVFVATYNENQNILTRTLTACKNMKYPEPDKVHIYICDDGNRLEIQNLAEELGVNYISRSSRKDAKAGNYNNALKKTSSPYIATFDADMAPTEDFLISTIPFHFKEKKVGFVQMPQSFINPDIFQYRFNLDKKIPFEQEYFYHSIQIAKNKTNSVVFCGTNALFSREALEATNGFATDTLTEDIATGMLIESKGYKGIAINKVGAHGICVNDFTSFAKQRSRWARGCVQMAKKYKILRMKGLKFRQKLEYLSCVSYWHFGFRRLIYLLAPLLFSIFGIIIVDCDLTTFVSIWLPGYLLKRYSLDLLEGKKRSSTWNKIYETIQTPILAFKVLKEFIGFKNSTFDVTPKNSSADKMEASNKRVLAFHLILFILNIAGFAMCFARIYDTNIYNYILSFVWTISNIFYLFIAIIFDLKYKKYNYKNFVPNKITKFKATSILAIFLPKKK